MTRKGDNGNKAAERQTQKKILQLLQQVGPINHVLLSAQFHSHNGYVEGALPELLRANYIEVDNRNMVRITDAGYRLLDDMKYWSEI